MLLNQFMVVAGDYFNPRIAFFSAIFGVHTYISTQSDMFEVTSRDGMSIRPIKTCTRWFIKQRIRSDGRMLQKLFE